MLGVCTPTCECCSHVSNDEARLGADAEWAEAARELLSTQAEQCAELADAMEEDGETSKCACHDSFICARFLTNHCLVCVCVCVCVSPQGHAWPKPTLFVCLRVQAGRRLWLLLTPKLPLSWVNWRRWTLHTRTFISMPHMHARPCLVTLPPSPRSQKRCVYKGRVEQWQQSRGTGRQKNICVSRATNFYVCAHATSA